MPRQSFLTDERLTGAVKRFFAQIAIAFSSLIMVKIQRYI